MGPGRTFTFGNRALHGIATSQNNRITRNRLLHTLSNCKTGRFNDVAQSDPSIFTVITGHHVTH